MTIVSVWEYVTLADVCTSVELHAFIFSIMTFLMTYMLQVKKYNWVLFKG